MSCSCALLYVMRRWKIISFTNSEPHGKETNSMILVPLRTVLRTLPLAVSYLLYLVCFSVLRPAISLLQLPFKQALTIICFCLKVSFNGVCSRDKCSYVHHSSTYYCGFYYAFRVYLGWPKTFFLCC